MRTQQPHHHRGRTTCLRRCPARCARHEHRYKSGGIPPGIVESSGFEKYIAPTSERGGGGAGESPICRGGGGVRRARGTPGQSAAPWRNARARRRRARTYRALFGRSQGRRFIERRGARRKRTENRLQLTPRDRATRHAAAKVARLYFETGSSARARRTSRTRIYRTRP